MAHEVSASIVLEEFERFEAARGKALLRIVARRRRTSAGPRGSILEPAASVLDISDRAHRLRSLPAPPDPSSRIRAAHSASTEPLAGAVRYSLELPDGSSLDLPAAALISSPPRPRGRRRS